MKDFFLGCDPGVSGCIGILNREGHPVDEIRFDLTIADIGAKLRIIRRSVSFAIIEKVSSSPQMGVTSSFTFGKAYGHLCGMITVCNIRHEYVTPQKWQAEMKCRSKGDKNVTKAAAQSLFPNYKIIHRNADAFLLAEFARRIAIERGW